MSFFSNAEVSEDSRRNIAFQVIIANRDLLQMASKKSQPPTYENALGLLNELAPELYEEFTDLLSQKNDSELVRYFQDLADIKTSETGVIVTAIELIDKQISMFEKLLEQDSSKRTINKRLLEHQIARAKLEPIRLTENRVLNRDFNKVDRSLYAQKLFEDDFFTDYKLNGDDILRVRFLHPDTDEHISGADLIYEQYDLNTGLVRFIFLQYKMWEDGVIYVSQAKNLDAQMGKMKSMLCDASLCCSLDGDWNSNKYRLPFCSAFLRPTDRLQDNDSKLMSSGYHVPVCKSIELAGEFGKIDKKAIREQSFNSKIFEDLFNSNMIGSRWIEVNELQDIYLKNGMFKHDDRIKLYAQEILEILPTVSK